MFHVIAGPEQYSAGAAKGEATKGKLKGGVAVTASRLIREHTRRSPRTNNTHPVAIESHKDATKASLM